MGTRIWRGGIAGLMMSRQGDGCPGFSLPRSHGHSVTWCDPCPLTGFPDNYEYGMTHTSSSPSVDTTADLPPA
jgi:hypothetical protein